MCPAKRASREGEDLPMSGLKGWTRNKLGSWREKEGQGSGYRVQGLAEHSLDGGDSRVFLAIALGREVTILS